MTFPSALPILSLLVWLPALGAVLSAIPASERAAPRRFLALGFAALTLGLGVALSLGFEGSGEHRELRAWVAPLGVSYELALDGLGSLLIVWIPLAALVALLAAEPLDRRVASLVLLGESALLGLSLSRDVVLFLAFLTAALIAFTLLHSGASAMKGFFFYQSLGVSLAAVFAMVFFHLALVQTGFPTGETARFQTLVTYPDFERRMFLLGAAGAVVLAPIVPFASWLRGSVESLSTPGRVVLFGGWSLTPCLLLSRLVVPALPLGRAEGLRLLVWVGAFATLYAGLVPYRGEARRSWVPLLVGFQGLALIGLASESPETVAAGRWLVLQLAFGLSALALWSGEERSEVVSTIRGRVLAVVLVALVLAFPAASGLPPASIVLGAHWDRFPTATVLAGIGSLAMVVRLALRLPSLERAAADRRNLLLVVPLLLWALALIASPRASTERIFPAGSEPGSPVELEDLE